jgi:hypothetical protein
MKNRAKRLLTSHDKNSTDFINGFRKSLPFVTTAYHYTQQEKRQGSLHECNIIDELYGKRHFSQASSLQPVNLGWGQSPL